MNYTPGPWSNDGKFGIKGGGTTICAEKGIVASVNVIHGRGTSIANARLISASPTMIEHISLMLRTVQDALRHGLTDGQREALEEMCKEAQEILARAKGGLDYAHRIRESAGKN